MRGIRDPHHAVRYDLHSAASGRPRRCRRPSSRRREAPATLPPVPDSTPRHRVLPIIGTTRRARRSSYGAQSSLLLQPLARSISFSPLLRSLVILPFASCYLLQFTSSIPSILHH